LNFELYFLDVDGLEALFALSHLELHFLAFRQVLIAVPFDGAVVDEDIVLIGPADEAAALGLVEPFDGAGFFPAELLLLSVCIGVYRRLIFSRR
jgi:hypothetical protein